MSKNGDIFSPNERAAILSHNLFRPMFQLWFGLRRPGMPPSPHVDHNMPYWDLMRYFLEDKIAKWHVLRACERWGETIAGELVQHLHMQTMSSSTLEELLLLDRAFGQVIGCEVKQGDDEKQTIWSTCVIWDTIKELYMFKELSCMECCTSIAHGMGKGLDINIEMTLEESLARGGKRCVKSWNLRQSSFSTGEASKQRCPSMGGVGFEHFE